MRRRRYEPRKSNSTFALNITSMTDMFTIMLVFLLQTYSTSDVEVIPETGIRLPSSNSTSNPVKGVKIAVTPNAIKIGDMAVAEMQNQEVAAKDIDPKDPNFIPSLFNELNKLAQNTDKEELKEGRIMLQADANLPYQTLRKLMYTASMAGFPQLKLVTTVGN